MGNSCIALKKKSQKKQENGLEYEYQNRLIHSKNSKEVFITTKSGIQTNFKKREGTSPALVEGDLQRISQLKSQTAQTKSSLTKISINRKPHTTAAGLSRKTSSLHHLNPQFQSTSSNLHNLPLDSFKRSSNLSALPTTLSSDLPSTFSEDPSMHQQQSQKQQQQSHQNSQNPLQLFLKKQLSSFQNPLANNNHQHNPAQKYHAQKEFKNHILLTSLESDASGTCYSGPTKNGLFDAFYHAYSFNEDLILSASTLWSQILTTLKLFYKNNNIPLQDHGLLSTIKSPIVISARTPDEAAATSVNPNPGQVVKDPHETQSLISWEHILHLMTQASSSSSSRSNELNGVKCEKEEANNRRVNNQQGDGESIDDCEYLEQQFAGNSCIYTKLLLADKLSRKSSKQSFPENLPYAVFPNHTYALRNIVFRDSLADWFALRLRIISLGTIAPDFWQDRLLAIVSQVINSMQGTVDQAFWDSGFLVKSRKQSLSPSSLQASGNWRFGWVKDIFMIKPIQEAFAISTMLENRIGAAKSVSITNRLIMKPMYFADISASMEFRQTYVLSDICSHRVDLKLTLVASMQEFKTPSSSSLQETYEPKLSLAILTSSKSSS